MKKYIFLITGFIVIGTGLWAINSASQGQSQGSKITKSKKLENPLGLQFTVYKSESCGCCIKWNDYLRSVGHDVTAHNTNKLYAYKTSVGVPDSLQSCHTAIVDGYVIEGHVPLKEIERLLRERPNAIGLSVPGMVSGSPGMENGRLDPYDVIIFYKDGRAEVFASY